MTQPAYIEGYEEQAQQFLDRYALSLEARYKDATCPPWENDSRHIHGERYRVTIHRTGLAAKSSQDFPRSISFDFWNSYKDAQEDKEPTAYDVLACLSADASMSTDWDEIFEEYGPIKPSQARNIARFAARLQAFFNADELEALGEIN